MNSAALFLHPERVCHIFCDTSLCQGYLVCNASLCNFNQSTCTIYYTNVCTHLHVKTTGRRKKLIPLLCFFLSFVACCFDGSTVLGSVGTAVVGAAVGAIIDAAFGKLFWWYCCWCCQSCKCWCRCWRSCYVVNDVRGQVLTTQKGIS